MKLFSVNDYDIISHNTVEVEIEHQGNISYHKINLFDFNRWVSKTDRDVLVYDWNGSEVEMKADNYWSDLPKETRLNDIYDYIILQNPDKIFKGFMQAMKETLDDYSGFANLETIERSEAA